VRFNFNEWLGWNFAGESRFGGGNLGVGGQFKNYWNFWVSTNLNGKSVSDSFLRGGPSIKLPGGQGYYASLSTDSRKKFRLNFGLNTFKREHGVTDNLGLSMGLTYKPTSALSIRIHPSVNFNRSSVQYVDSPDLGDETRYILASIDQTTYRLTIRLDYSITPKLSIQFYGQPFISTGQYSSFKRVTNPSATKFDDRYSLIDDNNMLYDSVDDCFNIDENGDGMPDYSIENPNFNFLQFSSNLVLRWEYADIDYNYGRNIDQLFRIYPENVFLIKFTYRIR